jgi:hypothetical protein
LYEAEQDRSGIHDPSHFAYPTYAKAAYSLTKAALIGRLKNGFTRFSDCECGNDLKSNIQVSQVSVNVFDRRVPGAELAPRRPWPLAGLVLWHVSFPL